MCSYIGLATERKREREKPNCNPISIRQQFQALAAFKHWAFLLIEVTFSQASARAEAHFLSSGSYGTSAIFNGKHKNYQPPRNFDSHELLPCVPMFCLYSYVTLNGLSRMPGEMGVKRERFKVITLKRNQFNATAADKRIVLLPKIRVEGWHLQSKRPPQTRAMFWATRLK